LVVVVVGGCCGDGGGGAVVAYELLAGLEGGDALDAGHTSTEAEVLDDDGTLHKV
jgi:hypothetical protein